MPESPLTTISVTVALSMHLVFKRYEPNILTFCTLVALFGVSILVFAIYQQGQSSISACVQMIGAITVFLLTLAFSVVTYRLSPWHPLASYPGPALAKVSKFWLSYCALRGDRYLIVDELHRTHGPWVRLGPNELSVSDPAAIRPVYGQCFRAPFYEAPDGSARAVIQNTDRLEHARRIVAWSKAFSPEYLRSYRYLVHARTAQLLNKLSNVCKDDNPINITYWLNLWTMDFVGDMALSGGIENLAAGADTEGWINAIQNSLKFVGAIAQTPWLWPLLGVMPVPGPIMTFQKFVGERVEEARRNSKGVHRNALQIIQDPESYAKPSDPSQIRGITKAEAVSDACLLITAGSDTVKSAVSSFIRYIAEFPEVQIRIREELKEAFGTSELDSDADTNILSTLPYLDACVNEVLRIMPPAPVGLPRYTDTTGKHILGQYVPPRTTIHCPVYTIHRDPNSFYEPDRFIPERWLEATDNKSSGKRGPHNQEAFFPFSYGPGMCVGRQVGLYNIKYLVASLIRTFEVSFAEDFDLAAFVSSYKEYSSWSHDPLSIVLKPRCERERNPQG